MPAVRKYNNLRDRGHYELPDLWPLNSPGAPGLIQLTTKSGVKFLSDKNAESERFEAAYDAIELEWPFSDGIIGMVWYDQRRRCFHA